MVDRWFQAEASQRFLQALDPSALGFTFQTFGDRDKLPNLARVYNGPFDQFADELIDLNHKGAGIYVTISRTDLAGRKRENVQRPRAVFCDFDGIEPPAGTGALPPSMVVQSKNGKHVYWLLDLHHEVDLAQWSLAQEALARKLGADPACKDPPRVMRLPGSQHLKSDPFGVELVECHDERRYQFDDIVRAYGLTLTPKSKPPPRRVDGEDDGPAGDFNQRGDWSFLTRHGWLHLRDYGPEGRWSRPGRDPPSISATTDHEDRTGIFYVFSSNAAPFEVKAYSRFQAYSILEHGGDYKAAARDLGAQGFGKDPKQWATERARERDDALMEQTLEAGPPDDLAARRRRRQSAATPTPPVDDVPFEPSDADAEAALAPADNNVVDLGKRRAKSRQRVHVDPPQGGGADTPEDGAVDFRVSKVTVYTSDPPLYDFEIEGCQTLRIDHEQLRLPKKFQGRYLAILHRMPTVPEGKGSSPVWTALVNYWLRPEAQGGFALFVEQPPEASEAGMIQSLLRTMLRKAQTGDSLEDLDRGSLLADPDSTGSFIVRAENLLSDLRQNHGMPTLSAQALGREMRTLRAKARRLRIGGQKRRVWSFTRALDEDDWDDVDGVDGAPQGDLPVL